MGGEMGTSSTAGWAVFLFFLGFTLVGTFFIGQALVGVIGVAIIIASLVTFQKARALEGKS
jgi:hypothetical protein